MTLVLSASLAVPIVIAPQIASAGLLDFLFNNNSPATAPATPQGNSPYADPSSVVQVPPPATSSSGGRFTAFCVRSCDGRYFPLSMRGGSTPAQMCQSFCPASPTKVFSGTGIDNAVSSNGERYPDSANAFAYRKALRADCTCNGRDPAGLAPVDLSLDPTLRPGDVIATANGLVAYSGTRTANGQTAEFTPIASYPGLTSEVRSRLGEMKVAPVSAEISEDTYSSDPDTVGSLSQPVASQPVLTTTKFSGPSNARM